MITINDQPWFVASDVCRVLDLHEHPRGGYAHHLHRHLKEDERRVTHMSEMGVRGSGRTSLVSESGLYKLIMRSDKPEAHQFQDWVTRIVLPAIRKDGMCVTSEEKVSTGEWLVRFRYASGEPFPNRFDKHALTTHSEP